MDLRNKNVIYIGGFGGIGFASCKCFLKENISSLRILDIKLDNDKLEELRSINKNATITFSTIDLRDSKSIKKVFATLNMEKQLFDLIINGAGIMNEEQIENTIKINLLGPIECTLLGINLMSKSLGHYGGRIVNISSLVALDAYGSYAVYTATKYGISGFTRALANPVYYDETGVDFITICPSTTETSMLATLRVNAVTTFNQKLSLPASLNNNQTADECAEKLIDAIKIGNNGSVWIISGGQLKEYKYPQIECL